MGIPFNADELFEIAEQIERNGEKFYHHAAEFFSQAVVRDKLLDLAEMEGQHEKTFAAMRAKLPDIDPAKITFDPDNQAALYLQAVADGEVFDLKNEPAAMFSEGITVEEVLDTAIGLEKESVVFYTGMKDLVGENFGRDKIDLIIREEIGHITLLRTQLKELK